MHADVCCMHQVDLFIETPVLFLNFKTTNNFYHRGKLYSDNNNNGDG